LALTGRAFLWAAVVALTVWSGSALAVQPDEILKDPALEARARALSQELRCMVCQNQSIDDSDAPLAKDLRVLVRERLTAGDSDVQVIDFMVARYGEFVLLKPRVSGHTLILWLAPFAALVIGGLGLIVFLRRRASEAEARTQEQLTPAEQSRIAELLKEPGPS
jgi:cytochrome c-type biogenesis protein CcmH